MSNSMHERLKKARIDKNLSQQELEKSSNVHYTNIGRYERGEAKPSSAILKRLADALEVSTDYLLNGTIDQKALTNLTDEKLLSAFRKIEQLPEPKKLLLLEFIDSFVFKANVQLMA